MHSMQNLEYQQCRTCYDSKSNLILLTSLADTCASQAAVDKSYAQLLVEVCNINIMDDKPLGRWPHFICLNCSHKLKIAYDFIQKTQQIDQLLQSIAKELENKGEPNFIEKPALDIPLEIKTEKEDVEIESNDREFQYSPDPVDVVKAELNSTTGGKHEQSPYNNNDFTEYKTKEKLKNDSENENTKEILEFKSEDMIVNEVLDTFDSKTISNMDNTKQNYNLNLTNNHDDELCVPGCSNTNTAVTHYMAFKCRECEKPFRYEWMLNRHERQSQPPEDKKFCCEYCDQKFSRPYCLKRHIEVWHPEAKKIVIENSNIKKVSCNVCEKKFLDNRRLARHKRYVHVPEEQKIPCNLCGVRIARTDNFLVHMKRKHNVSIYNNSEESVYCCDKCDYVCTQRTSLVNHERQMHWQ